MLKFEAAAHVWHERRIAHSWAPHCMWDVAAMHAAGDLRDLCLRGANLELILKASRSYRAFWRCLTEDHRNFVISEVRNNLLHHKANLAMLKSVAGLERKSRANI